MEEAPSVSGPSSPIPRVVVIAVDASHTAEHAFECKWIVNAEHPSLKPVGL